MGTGSWSLAPQVACYAVFADSLLLRVLGLRPCVALLPRQAAVQLWLAAQVSKELGPTALLYSPAQLAQLSSSTTVKQASKVSLELDL